MLMFKKIITFSLFMIFTSKSFSLQEVKIYGVFPFASHDPNSIENATYTFDERLQIITGIPMAMMYYQNQAEKCGYSFSYKFNGFNFFDQEGLKKSIQVINMADPWIIYGPEMNTSYYLVNPYLNKSIPHVTSFTLLKNNENRITISPSVSDEIKALVNVLKSKKIGKNYIILSDATCDMCQVYDSTSQKIFKSNGFNLKEKIIYDEKKIDDIKDKIRKENPDFIFLNVNGSNAGLFMSNTSLNEYLFVGTKIWGTDVSSDPALNFNLQKVSGFTVRPLPPDDYSAIKMQIVDSNSVSKRMMDNPYYMKFFVSKITENLCKYKPKDRFAFGQIVKEKNIFSREKYKFATYTLKNGLLTFENSFEMARGNEGQY
ncbi:MAG: hypothetical protein K2X69_06245 [Silvanigrellaceae bacterium]|nr:hypothetical protein [Silvanigrellaceae bacterium]